MSDSTKPSVLYVDDERYNLITFKAVFREYFNIFTALTVAEAWEHLNSQQIDAIISDYKMPEMNGMDFLTEVERKLPGKALILSSGLIEPLPDSDSSINVTLLPKPWDEQVLKATVFQVLGKS